ncbi:MAG: M56 family metallopeptidase [Dorea sp.]|nr:M56 family metallopeptidase [Dorea sp.]
MDWMDLLGWTNWTVSVVCCLFLTSVTGSVLFVFWYVLGRWLEKAGFINILYALMKFLMLFFTVPVLYVTMSRLDSEYGIYRGRLFEYTGTIIAVCDILLLLWAAGACYILYRNLRLMHQSRKMYENSFPCEQHKEEMFWRVKKDMGIREGAVKLLQSFYMPTAVLWGGRHPAVILPVQEYSDEELKVIFVHELTHYKNHDLLWRRIASVLVGIHFFNSLVWRLHSLLRKWSEYACDFEAYEMVGGVKHYFGTIIQIQMKMSGLSSYFAATLNEDENELEERIEKMMIQKKIKRCSPWKAAVICGAMLMGSSMTVFAASEGIAKAYYVAVETTVVETEEEMEPELPEYEESGEPEGIIEEVGEVDKVSRGMNTFEWTVSNGIRKTTDGFSAKSGGSITLTVDVTPEDRTIRAGIIEPEGNRKYTTGKGYLSRKFSLTKSGTYKVYVENSSGAKVTVDGSYNVK